MAIARPDHSLQTELTMCDCSICRHAASRTAPGALGMLYAKPSFQPTCYGLRLGRAAEFNRWWSHADR